LITVAGTQGYGDEAEALTLQYESVAFEVAHRHSLHLYPVKPSRILDVGAGTGRDAAALASRGHEVYAVEPTQALRNFGEKHHAESSIRWLDDFLPALPATVRLGLTFDLVLLTAVLMHLDVNERKEAMAVLTGLLAANGQLILSLRHGPVPEGRVMFEVSDSEMDALAQANGLSIVFRAQPEDVFQRAGVHWNVYALMRRS
jgi:2-polyprenyl-3-methyl-5-hydroxy-6-metoxy-1,4-benzoquinol methylase